jgi:putative salt-induced outer membrane protein
MKTIVISGAIALLSGAATAAVPLPDAVAAMIEAAAGNADQLRAVVEVAKKTNPGSVAEIEARAAALRTAKVVAREQRLAAQGVFNGWSGSGEAGGFISSGNTSNKGVAIGINIVKETRTWKHAVRGQVDYQEDNNVKSRERYFAGYEGNYRVTPNFYVLGTLSYERDIFSGFNQRFAESFGIGYKLVNAPRVQVAIDGGPAVRQTQYKNARSDNSFAGRAGLNAKW